MTSEGQTGQPTQDDHDPLGETQRLDDQSSWSRRKSRSPQAQRKNRWIGIGLSLAVLAGVVAAIVSVTTTGTHQAASSNSSVPGASPATSGSGNGGTASQGGTSTAKGKVISAASLAEKGGALSVPKTMHSSVVRWQSGAGGRNLTAVSSGLGHALQAGGIKQYVTMRYACTQLGSSVATAAAGPQIPDATMQGLYTKALTELAKGAADCQAAISVKPSGDETNQTNVDTTKLHQSTSELSAGATDIFRATAQIPIIARQGH
jgi:hypothetical protein